MIFTDLERLSKLSTEERRHNYFCDEKDCRNVADIPTWQEQYKKHHKTLSEKGKHGEGNKIMGSSRHIIKSISIKLDHTVTWLMNAHYKI